MNIALLNKRITFQRGSVVTDAIGNRSMKWDPCYNCMATISGESGARQSAAGMIATDDDISFTVRYCPKVLTFTTLNFRILFNGNLYSITSIDHLSYKGEAVKFNCKKWSES